jgi:hypothetical protein
MSFTRGWIVLLIVPLLAIGHGLVPLSARGIEPPAYVFATPVFGLASRVDGLLVADAGAGIVKVGLGGGSLLAALPGVTDVAPTLLGLLAVTGGSTDPSQITPFSRKLFRVVQGQPTEVADLGAFEETVNPDGGEINSNPFDVAALPNGSALVADAGGNALLIVNARGTIDWVATLPTEPVETANVKLLFNCPAGPPDICNLPPMIPAEPVLTSVAVGPDGAYYVGELKGFPAPTGRSRVWRIEPGARHAECGTSPACQVVATGFTSIIDLAFSKNGTLHVVELDEASWFAVEVTQTPVGGTVNACSQPTPMDPWQCEVEAAGLMMPTAAVEDVRGNLRVVINALIPGAAQVITIP